MADLLCFRDRELAPELAPKLAPFIYAYRPHSEVPERKMLKAQGYELVEKESFWDEFEELYVELNGCLPEEKLEV